MSDVKVAPPKPGKDIYDQTEARARTFVLQLAWLLPCLLVFVFFFYANFRGLHSVDAMDTAQLARHISRGEGYTTSLLRPFALTAGRPATAQPERLQAPLYPLVLAVAFNALAPSDRTVALVATLCGVLTALLAYLIARRLLDRTAAGLAALLVSLNVGFLSSGVGGRYFTFLALLTTLLAWLLVRHTGRVRESAWCGAVCGLLYLAEYAMLPLLLVVTAVIALGQSSRRRAHVVVCLLGFLVLTGPWLARDWWLSGGPFSTPRARAIACLTDTYPQSSLYRSSPRAVPSSLSYVTEHPRQVVKKSLLGLTEVESRLPFFLESALLLLLGVALLVDLGRPEARRLRWVMVGGAGLVMLSLLVGIPNFEVLYAFLGIAAALSAVGLLPLLRARALSPRVYAALLACVIGLAAFPFLLTLAMPARRDPPDHSSLEVLKKTLPENALVVTDEPWSVSWYAERAALWLPQESAPGDSDHKSEAAMFAAADSTQQPEFQALERMGFKPTAIFLTSQFVHCPEEMTRWQWLQQALMQQAMSGQGSWTPSGWSLVNIDQTGQILLQRTDSVAAP